jgi:hypothetical protein
MLGGSTASQHWNLPDETNKAKTALRAGTVDVLTLSPFQEMPDKGITNFTNLGIEHNAKLRVFVQASWPAFDSLSIPGHANVQQQRNTMNVESLRALQLAQNSTWRKILEEQIHALNTAIGRPVVELIPVNDAVFTLRERIVAGTVPGLSQQTDLFKDNIGHPTSPLALLVTYCHFSAIYDKSPIGLPVPASIAENPHAAELTTVLQTVAWETVTTYKKAHLTVAKKRGL